ncbi:hypothetical protein BT93_J0332 [Corymbia citriodora subsp. variegata]|nr:hypothetical protein BT93_J0332 [Corymbia citriodora subsp. variegata]
MIQKSIRWVVGNVEKINIREDPWLSRGLIDGLANRGDSIPVSELMVVEEAKWNEEMLEGLFDFQTIQEILAISINLQLLEDKLIWKPTKIGQFIVKSAYTTVEHNRAQKG